MQSDVSEEPASLSGKHRQTDQTTLLRKEGLDGIGKDMTTCNDQSRENFAKVFEHLTGNECLKQQCIEQTGMQFAHC